MRSILLLFLIIILNACTNKTDLDVLIQKKPTLKQYVDNLKTTEQVYESCKECKLIGLEGENIIGNTNKYPHLKKKLT